MPWSDLQRLVNTQDFWVLAPDCVVWGGTKSFQDPQGSPQIPNDILETSHYWLLEVIHSHGLKTQSLPLYFKYFYKKANF